MRFMQGFTSIADIGIAASVVDKQLANTQFTLARSATQQPVAPLVGLMSITELAQLRWVGLVVLESLILITIRDPSRSFTFE